MWRKVVNAVLCLINIVLFLIFWLQSYAHIKNRCLNYFSDNIASAKGAYIGGSIIVILLAAFYTICYFYIGSPFICISQTIMYILLLYLNTKTMILKNIMFYPCSFIGALFGNEWESNIIMNILGILLGIVAIVLALAIFSIITSGIIPLAIVCNIETGYKETITHSAAHKQRDVDMEIIDAIDEYDKRKQMDHIEESLDDIDFQLRKKR